MFRKASTPQKPDRECKILETDKLYYPENFDEIVEVDSDNHKTVSKQRIKIIDGCLTIYYVFVITQTLLLEVLDLNSCILTDSTLINGDLTIKFTSKGLKYRIESCFISQSNKLLSIFQYYCRKTNFLSNFEILKRIGKGSYANVYKAKKNNSNERLAVKVYEKKSSFYQDNEQVLELI